MLKNKLSPLEKSFIVSAPAKVIVFGEHGAVYGKSSIAAAISLRSYLHVQTLPASEHIVALDFREIDLYYTWSIDTLPWPHPDSRLRKCHGSSLDGTLLAAIEPLVEAVSPDLPQKERKIHQGSARVFLYLFLSLGSPESPGAVYKNVSENALRRFDQEIANEGFKKHQVVLGAAGVAVRGCSLAGDEVEGGIDRGEFANEDTCTVEQLVGLAGNQLETGEGWISWR
ncbi:Mevalonate kinase [Ophidiomyces ophidiicola]|nr:Mevalonate kinase [Ophidiomyces ophidiicola]